jgi:hypothetical protein
LGVAVGLKNADVELEESDEVIKTDFSYAKEA